MTIRDVLLQAGQALTVHRLRTVLSATGIVIGVATVVAAFAIGEGASLAAHEEFAQLGTRNVFLRSVPGEVPADSRLSPPAPLLSLADAGMIKRTLSEVTLVSARRALDMDVSADGHLDRVPVAGVTPDWEQVFAVRLEHGRWLTERDEEQQRRVAVVAASLGDRLFAGRPPVGRDLLLGDTWFRVVGVAAGPVEQVWVPLSTLDVSLGADDALERVQEIVVQARRVEHVERVALAAEQILRANHGDVPDGWTVVVPQLLLEARLRAQRTSRVVLLGVGGLALLISGVGIMNIMLASVMERVHEIGVRRAFGATRSSIVRQFAAEATVLCVAGGVIGLPLGVGLAWTVAFFGEWPVAISGTALLLSVALAGGVGLLFGVYPASMAANLDPAVALRSE